MYNFLVLYLHPRTVHPRTVKQDKKSNISTWCFQDFSILEMPKIWYRPFSRILVTEQMPGQASFLQFCSGTCFQLPSTLEQCTTRYRVSRSYMKNQKSGTIFTRKSDQKLNKARFIMSRSVFFSYRTETKFNSKSPETILFNKKLEQGP